VARDLHLWAYQRGVTLDFSRPGKPTENAFIEAFNGRAECLTATGSSPLLTPSKKWRIAAVTITKNVPTGRSVSTGSELSVRMGFQISLGDGDCGSGISRYRDRYWSFRVGGRGAWAAAGL